MRDVYPQRDVNSRTRGPAVTSAGDGLEGVYSGVLHTVPSGGACKVLIPAFSLTSYYTAKCPTMFSGVIGDAVLVAFDEQKQPWLIVPSALTLPTLTSLGITRGHSTFTWAGGTAVSGVITVAHGLSSTPSSVNVTSEVTSGGFATYGSVTLGSVTATQFQVIGVATAGSPPAANTAKFYWTAIL